MPRVVTVNGVEYHFATEKHERGLIGICKELPEVAVYGKDEDELRKELEKALKGYLETFASSDVRPAAAN